VRLQSSFSRQRVCGISFLIISSKFEQAGVDAEEPPATCLPFSFREYSCKLGVWKKAFLWGLESHRVIFSPKGKGYFETWIKPLGLQIIQI